MYQSNPICSAWICGTGHHHIWAKLRCWICKYFTAALSLQIVNSTFLCLWQKWAGVNLKRQFLLWVVATTARRNVSNDGPSFSEWGLTKPIFMNQKFSMARYHLNYGSPIIIPRYISNRKINQRKNFWSEKKRTAVSGCQLRAGEKKRPKLLPEKLLRPADNPPNLPSVQNNRFLLSGFLHFFPFSGKSPEFWCRTIYGTLYYLVPAPPPYIPKKRENHKVFANFFNLNSCGNAKCRGNWVYICWRNLKC